MVKKIRETGREKRGNGERMYIKNIPEVKNHNPKVERKPKLVNCICVKSLKIEIIVKTTVKTQVGTLNS